MSRLGWPTCTTAGCRHEMIHGSSEEATVYAREHMDEFVDKRGDCVCECHERSEASRIGVKRFNCGSRPLSAHLAPPDPARAGDTSGEEGGRG